MMNDAEAIANAIVNAFFARNPDISKKVASDCVQFDHLQPETIELVRKRLDEELMVY